MPDPLDELSNEPRTVPPVVKIFGGLLAAIVIGALLWQSHDSTDPAASSPGQPSPGQPSPTPTQRPATFGMTFAGISYTLERDHQKRRVLLAFDVVNWTERDIGTTVRYPVVPGLRERGSRVVRTPEGLTPRRPVASSDLYFPALTDSTLSLSYSVSSCHPGPARPPTPSAELHYRRDGQHLAARVDLPHERGRSWSARVLAMACRNR
jgi:hypothetical protein